jgi:uncharacterized repeat protein (TIGR02543 family)
MKIFNMKRIFLALIISLCFIISLSNVTFAQVSELSVSSVTASADDGNVPENTLDNDLNTRWSADGDGQWIQYDLGSSYTIAYVSIAWYKGNERSYSFDIQVSNDAVNWTQVFSGSSSGTTLQQENFDFTDTPGRYVRYVGHMNSYNTWNSVTEVDIYGSSGGTTQYTLTTNTSGSGSVSLNPSGGTYDSGTVVTLTATPESGWEFSGWSGDLSGSTNPTTIMMNANKSVTATFTQIQYTLAVNTFGSGSVSLNPSGGTYNSGTVVTLTATPNSGWQFDGWSGDLSGSTNPTTITMNSNKSVTASFSTIPVGGDVVFEEVKTGSSSGSATVASASLTGVSGHLYLAAISCKPNRSVNSVSGLGLTWTLVDEQCGGRNQTGVSVWMAQGTPSGNGTVTATLSSAPTNAVIMVTRYSGVNASNPIGNIISANSNGADGSCSGGVDATTYSVNLTTTASGAVAYGAVALRSRDHAPGAGYTERGEIHYGSGGDIAGVAVEDKSVSTPGTVAVNGTFSSSNDWAVIAVEITPGGGSGPTQYTLTTSTSGSGNISLNPSGGTYDSGTVVTLTATPASGWQFAGWSGDLSGSTNPTTITMDANKTVTATFTQIQYTLTVNTSGSGNVSLSPSGGTYNSGTVVTLTATPSSGWQFSSWSGDLSGSTNPTTLTMNSNKTVTATFTEISVQYTLTVNTSGSGSVTLNPSGGTYNSGTVVTLTATPASGWQFSGWSGDLSGSTNPTTITMNANKNVTATFTQIQYTLTVNTSGSGSVALNPSGGTYNSGTVVTLTATPSSGWQFSGWSGDLSGSTNPTTITMNANKSVTATFTEESGEPVELSVSSVIASADDGNVPANTLDNNLSTRWSADGDGQWIRYDLGSSYTVAYVSIAWYKGNERSYYFDIEASSDATNWTQVFSGTSTGNTLQQVNFDFTDTSARYVRYVGHMNSYNTWNSVTEVDIYGYSGGTPTQYTLTVNTSGSGSVELNPSGGTYNSGTVVTLTATPNSGWQFDGWSGDLSGSTNPITLTMNSNKTVTATFSETSVPQYTLTVNITGTGTVTLNPSGGTYNSGTVVTLTANPGSNWSFSSWSGDLSGSTNPTTITMSSNKSVTATFTYQGQTVTGLWSSADELASAPTSGAAWDAVYSAANQSFYPPVVDNQDSDDNIQCLAAAIVYARTGNQTFKTKVTDACAYLASHGAPMDRTLAWAREVGAYALAADLVGYRTTAFETWLRNMAEVWDASDGWTVLEMFYDRPNNWGTHGFGMLVSVYAYLQDTDMLETIRDYWIQGVTGPNPGYTYGDLSWQANPNDPRQINPTGSVKNGLNIDGVLPDDMRRGGSFSIPPGHTGYCWEALQGLIMAARVLERYDPDLSIWSVDNNAIYRAGYILQIVYENDFGGWAATGDDEWMLPFYDDAYGTSWSDGSSDEWGAGKNTGWAYVLLGSSGMAKPKAPELLQSAVVIPDEYCLHQNYPNPFNPATNIQIDLPKAGHITMVIYDMMGRKVATLVDGFRSSGTYTVEWNAVDSSGHRLPSGIYLCRIQSGSYVRTIKIMLMR